MRRLLAILTGAAVALTVPPLSDRPARAAIGATLMVDCSPPADDCWPIAFAFTPNGKELFYLERFTGEIHRVRIRRGRDTVWGQVGPVAGAGEQGALGLALDPKWGKGKNKKRKRRNRRVYVLYTNDSPRENRLVRLRKPRRKPGAGRAPRVREQGLLVVSIDTGATNHNAGPLAFGPDRKLYVLTGDQAQPSRSQDVGDTAGKVLRLNRNGGRPKNNPIPGSPAFSFGHRNGFGMGFDPATGSLWQSENGPNCDEINLVLPGRNYGWGPGSSNNCPTSTVGPSPTPPEREWEPAIVPTGVSFCRGCGLGPGVEGDVLMGTFGGEIRGFDLDAQGDDVTGETTILDHPSGILTLARRKNGQMWFSDRSGIYRLTGP